MPSEPITPRNAFQDPRQVARYADGPPRFVPGFADMHRMVTLLLAERVPTDGRVLVVGAGGGLELRTFAQAHPGWTFEGVDPSAEMLQLAEQTLGPLASRVRLRKGAVDVVRDGPFDAATCLLTLHFLARDERRRTLEEIRHRLKPGAPFVSVHASVSTEGGGRSTWLTRHVDFAASSGAEIKDAQTSRATIETHLSLLTPEEDEAVLREAGFKDVGLFYAGFTFRGWVAYV